MATYPLATLAPTIDSAGITAPSYNDIYQSLIASFKLIYGSDIYIASDSQDGQWIAILAKAIHDSNQAAITCFLAYSPTYSQGNGLSAMVKINGIRRLIPTYSSVDLLLIGQAGTTITNGVAEDSLGQKWNLPASVTFPLGGSITVTATAANAGAVDALANTITKIATPTLGWQSVNNVLAAVPGAPTENDLALRSRQSVSTALPSLSVFEGTVGAVANVTGVLQYKGYENYTDATDANGLPPHSISIVVEGGDSQLIANAIAVHKTPGTNTYGTTAVLTYDQYGLPNTINFYRPTIIACGVEITITALVGYTTGFATDIANAVAAYLSAFEIGEDIYLTKLYVPANLDNVPEGQTFNVTQIRIKKGAGAFGTTDLVYAFNELVSCNPLVDVTVIVV